MKTNSLLIIMNDLASHEARPLNLKNRGLVT